MRRIHASALLLAFGCNFGSMTPADTASDESDSEASGDGDDASTGMSPGATSSTPGESTGSETDSSDDASDVSESSGSGDSDSESDTGVIEHDWALEFDGDDEASTKGPIEAAALAPEFTVEAWIRVDSEVRGVMLDTRNGAPGTVGWVFYVSKDAPHTLVFGFNTDSGGEALTGPDLADLDLGWHHVAATRTDAGRFSLWIDGAEAASANSTDAPVSDAVPLRVGRFFDTAYDYWLRGGLDDVHISTVARYEDTFTPMRADADEFSSLMLTFSEGEDATSTYDDVEGVELVLSGATWTAHE